MHNSNAQIAQDQGISVTIRDTATGQEMTLIFGAGEDAKRGTMMMGHVKHEISFHLVKLPHADPISDLTLAIHVENNERLPWKVLEARLTPPSDISEQLKSWKPVNAVIPPTVPSPVVAQAQVVDETKKVDGMPVINKEVPNAVPPPVPVAIPPPSGTAAEVPPPAPPAPRPPVPAKAEEKPKDDSKDEKPKA